MPITVQWDNPEHTVLYQRLEDDWSWAELHAAMHQIREYLDAAAGPVDSLIDLTGMTKIPPGAVHHVRPLLERHASTGVLVVFGANLFARMMAQMMQRIYPRSRDLLRVVDDEAAARAALAEIQQARLLRPD
ncbi:MAG: hypothetical protein MUE40_18595 [Anaerolineae bacterium]|nr:hypothetical protein [Anaerolineae bacterium]